MAVCPKGNSRQNNEEHKMINLLQGDCLELMKDIPDKSIDLILCDLPYGLTHCDWDIPLNMESMWGGV